MLKRVILILLSFFSFSQFLQSQSASVTISGRVKSLADKSDLPFVSIVLKREKDSVFVMGTVSNEEGRFSLSNIKSGSYLLGFSYTGYETKIQPVLIGSLSTFLDLGNIELQREAKQLKEVIVSSNREAVSARMDKKTYSVTDNISQACGSVLQILKNLPGITTSQDGKVELRGS